MEDGDTRDNAKLRVHAMTDGFNVVEEMIYAMDVRLEDIAKEPAPTFDVLKNKAAAANKEIDDAKLFMRGSEEYENAAKAFEKMNKKFSELGEKYQGKEDKITVAELEELDALFGDALSKVQEYTSQKHGETLSDNTHKRTEAMSDASTALLGAKRRIEELRAAKEAKPAKEMAELQADSSVAYVAILNAERDVHFGSDEYKNAKEDYKAYSDHLKVISQEGHQISRKELDDLDRLATKSNESINKYLATKKGADLGPKTQKRVDAMRQASENIFETKKRHHILQNTRAAEVSAEPKANLRTNEFQVLRELSVAKDHVNENRVWFGGKDYDKALELYQKAVNNEVHRDAAREENPPSRNGLNVQLDELVTAQNATIVYIERKEKEIRDSKKPLDYKGQKRLEEMRNAYDSLGKRIDIAKSKLETLEANETAEFNRKMDAMVEEKRAAIPGKTGFDKVLAITAADDADMLRSLAGKKNFDENDMVKFRLAAASMLLHQKFENKEIKRPEPASVLGYGKMVTQVANSREFMAMFPKGNMTPAAAKRMLCQPGVANAMNTRFNENVKKAASNKSRELDVLKKPAKEGPVAGPK